MTSSSTSSETWFDAIPRHALALATWFLYLNRRRRGMMTRALRILPGTSERFGPPRNLVPMLRSTISGGSGPAELLRAGKDTWAELNPSEVMSFGGPKTLPGRPDSMKRFAGEYLQPDSFLFTLQRARLMGH